LILLSHLVTRVQKCNIGDKKKKKRICLISGKIESDFGGYDGLGSLVPFVSKLVLVVIKIIYFF
jgi:hypothetical protein